MRLFEPVAAPDTQMAQRHIADTRTRIEDACEAQIAFAFINGRLPCPATTAGAGLEAPRQAASAPNLRRIFAGVL